MSSADLGPRVATAAEAEVVTGLVSAAFHDDPTWSWAFPDPAARDAQYRTFWRVFVEGALRYPWVWLAPGDAATSVWIPPGGTELSPAQEDEVDTLLAGLLGDGASRVHDLFEQFEAAHPRVEPHYYLSLLATDPARRGQGHGLRLLAANLTAIDAQGMPAYLEASNPANVALYRRHGFEPVGSFTLPANGPTVTTMWRPAAA